jgi:hypothetical protein
MFDDAALGIFRQIRGNLQFNRLVALVRFRPGALD